MVGLRNIYRFNARVLNERMPPGLEAPAVAVDAGEIFRRGDAVAMAFSEESAAIFKGQGISCSPGAGGVVARIDAETLARLDENPESAALAEAVRHASLGWAKNAYNWRIGSDKCIELGGRPKVMGILNVTPDSFSDGGLFLDEEEALKQARAMIAVGADIIDVGGESTRPGAREVDAAEEVDRTATVIRRLKEETNAVISIDTTKAKVAAAALDAGAEIINDISGFTFDDRMIPLAAERKAGVVIMHIKGRPRTMQNNPGYDDTVAEVAEFLRNRVIDAMEGGIALESIVLDPGIGFGKRFEDNLALLARMGELRSLGLPLLLGCSRKSFLGQIGRREALDRVTETTATSVLAAAAGVQVVRVHDVEENVIALKVAEAIHGHVRPRLA